MIPIVTTPATSTKISETLQHFNSNGNPAAARTDATRETTKTMPTAVARTAVGKS